MLTELQNLKEKEIELKAEVTKWIDRVAAAATLYSDEYIEELVRYRDKTIEELRVLQERIQIVEDLLDN